MFTRIASRSLLISCARPLSVSSSLSSSVSLCSSSIRAFSAAPSNDVRRAPLVSKPAQALFKAASKDAGKDTLDKVAQNLTEFSAAFDKVGKLRFVSTNPTLKPEEKKKKFLTIFPKLNYHPIAQEILIYFLATAQGDKLKELTNDYKALVNFHKNETLAIVTTAEKLSPNQLSKVTNAIKAKLAPGEKMSLEQRVEPSIMGGMIVQVGGKSLDLSVIAQIRKIDQALRQA